MMRIAASLTIVWMAPAAAWGQVAITEFLVDPDGTDAGREWVELFNFGPQEIELAGWTIADEDSDDFALPALTLRPGAHAILVSGGAGVDAPTAKAIFEVEWLGGAANPAVIGMSGTSLANGADELVLRDPSGTVVWSLAWLDDDTTARATFLTQSTDFSVSAYGSQEAPGVDRDGDDNGTPGFPGYQDNGVTPDPGAVISDISQLVALFGEQFANVSQPSVGSPLAGAYSAIPNADLDHDGQVGITDLLSLLPAWGACPGPCPPACPADLDGDCVVGIEDLLELLKGWT
jgi:hypothetical protein